MDNWKIEGKPALIIVHMQNAITDPDGPLAPLGHAKASRESGIIPKQQALLKAFREKKLPVIYVNAITETGTKFPVYGRFWSLIKESGVNEPGSPDVDVIEELAPQPGEPVLTNWPFSIFVGNNLDEVLKGLGVDTLVLVGVATGMALGTAAFAASDLFYNLIIPSDTAIDANKDLHDIFFTRTFPAISLVTTSEDVIAHL